MKMTPDGKMVPVKEGVKKTTGPSGLPLDVPQLPKGTVIVTVTAAQLLSTNNGLPQRAGRKPRDPDLDKPNGHWRFPEKMDPHHYYGFIYLVHDRELDKYYIGSKRYISNAIATKGQESNWKTYVTSSKNIGGEIMKRGSKESFTFYCLEQYVNRGTIGWAEVWSLCFAEVLNNQDKWYNGLIQKVSWKVSERITERHKARLIGLSCLRDSHG